MHETWCRHWWMSFYISFQFLYFSIWILLSPAWTVYHEPDQENNYKAADLLHADITVMHIQAVVVSDDVTYWWFTLYETSVYCWLIVYWSQALGNQSAVNKSFFHKTKKQTNMHFVKLIKDRFTIYTGNAVLKHFLQKWNDYYPKLRTKVKCM